MRILFALSGFHRVDRGAETALLALAEELAATGDDVTVAGSGQPRPDTAYRFVHVPSRPREGFERWPKLPALRNEMAYEEASFAFHLRRADLGDDYDLTLTCGYPWTNWTLRRRYRQTPHVFVTENGHWPAVSAESEYRFFDCAGLVCTNPRYFAETKDQWNAALIPNGVPKGLFGPGKGIREELDLPTDRPIVLMVSAFMGTKRVLDGMRAVAKTNDAFLLVAGDGPLREEGDRLAAELLPGRYRRLTLPAHRMPKLYRSADVFLHMSKVESFGNVYVEAATTGLPVVAHDYELTRWIVGDEQFLCDTDSSAETAAAIERAIAAGPQEPSPRLERFTWRAIAKEYRSFFETIVSRPPRR